MIVVLLFGLVSLAGAVALTLRAGGFRRAHVDATFGDIGRYGGSSVAVPAAGGETPLGLFTRLESVANRLGDLAARLGWLREEELRTLLRTAGLFELRPRTFLGYRVLAGAGLPAFWLWAAGGGSLLRTLAGFAFTVVLGWKGPLVYLRRRARLRLEEIDDQMPELIDLLVTTVEAGLGLSASLRLAAERLQGPLGEELRLSLAEQDMGLSAEDALANMLERADTPSMRSFVRSLHQGTTLGVSIGKILRDLADEMRKRRRQRAEERAQKAPTKLLFPLVLLIFPAMFVVLLGPAVVQFLRGFASI
jgi:tight adherence protein C